MNIGERFKYVDFIVNKEQSGNISPAEFNLQNSQAEIDFFRSISRPPADQFHSWRTLRGAVDDIRLQTLKRDFVLTFTNARANLPNLQNSSDEFMDWLSFGLLTIVKDNCNVNVDSEVPVEVVMEDEWSTRLYAAIRKPTLRYPIVKFVFNTVRQVQVAPTAISSMRLSYYKKPIAPVFAFTQSANNQVVYNPTLSTQSEFDSINDIPICNILLKKIGINLSEQALQNYADQAKAQV